MEKSVNNEKKILMLCNSEFIVRCFATYNTQESLYFLLEPCLGGELYATYHKHRFHGSGTKARFYVASTTFALVHLHERQVLYRDLKPENLILDKDGRCKLTDMGLAKQTAVKTYTTCGTPDYFAPEVINQHLGQTEAVDWWTVGVLIHELMSGHTPFEAPTPPQIYQKAVRGTAAMTFPDGAADPEGMDVVG